ncbi:penicillin-insensitive murein endopeptidase [Humitalea rosea]|uniref:Penicillin-insensitive murein endopeptidase n=1 Tax=Humitalea rosea TaxID=990373 RepID=A0A2W7ITC9_9PROT|nr:penicillin-insensitive murein endopeptidase [Humitalea rosea]PZW49123.1 penicillin-insensitive murein endopeptidase [Humitalea rosea]
MRTLLAACLLWPGLAWAQPVAEWAAVRAPSGDAPRIVGEYSNGCIGGAAALPLQGPGWQVVRASRNRFYGHPSLVGFIEGFAARARAAGFADLWIGDMGQPRGGPLPFGHASHQIGLDVDVWLDLDPKPVLPLAARERIEVPSLVLPDESGVDPARFSERHAALIRLAAESPGVDRIFVNFAIKRALCTAHRGEAFLRRVRPWYGHDSHMHVRLACPAGSPGCIAQAPPPGGDGCDTSLEWWFSEQARHPPRSTPGARPRLPAACAGLLRR